MGVLRYSMWPTKVLNTINLWTNKKVCKSDILLYNFELPIRNLTSLDEDQHVNVNKYWFISKILTCPSGKQGCD